MVAAVGLGGVVAGLFHMTTHAFFKACLFLSAGAVIHASWFNKNYGSPEKLGGELNGEAAALRKDRARSRSSISVRDGR